MNNTLYILGASNSILRNGFVSYLQEHFKVNNLSIGASPFYQFVFNILQIDREKFYAENGLIIIESIVNDDNILGCHASGLLAMRAMCARQALLFAGSRFPIVVVEFLNKRHYSEKYKSFFSILYRQLCSEYGIPFFSFADALKKNYPNTLLDDCYMDEGHIKPELAYALTPHLINFIDKVDWSRTAQRSDFSNYYSSYSYLAAENATLQVGTSLRQFYVKSGTDKDVFSFKGHYFLEAVIIDISKTNCILAFTSNDGIYYQGLRYNEKQRSEFKIVALQPLNCSESVELRILSQQTFYSKSGDQAGILQCSPHEDRISTTLDMAQARIVGFIVRNV